MENMEIVEMKIEVMLYYYMLSEYKERKENKEGLEDFENMLLNEIKNIERIKKVLKSSIEIRYYKKEKIDFNEMKLDYILEEIDLCLDEIIEGVIY